MALTRDIVNIDALELVTTPLRSPQYAFEGERLFHGVPATIESVMQVLKNEHYVHGDYRTWPFRATEHVEMVPSAKGRGHTVPRSSDLLFSLRFTDSVWTGSAPVDVGTSPLSAHLARTFSQLWDCDGTPLGRLVAGYIQGTYQTPYLRLARRWMKGGMPIGILDLILGYAYGPDIVRLMKLPPASAIIEPEWELVPVMSFNDVPVDAWNLDPREPIAIVALPYNVIEVHPQLVERDRKTRELDVKFRLRSPPPMFGSGRGKGRDSYAHGRPERRRPNRAQ